MEENEIIVNATAKRNCGTIATWATFLGVMCALSAAMLILMGIVFIVLACLGTDMGEELPSWVFIIYAVVFPVIGALYIIPAIYCFKVGRHFSRLQKTDDPEDFYQGFSYVKSTYKFIGLFTIFSIVFSIVLVAVVVVVALATI